MSPKCFWWWIGWIIFYSYLSFYFTKQKKKKVSALFPATEGLKLRFFSKASSNKLAEQAKTIELPFLFSFIFINENKILGWVLIKISYVALVLALSLISIQPKVFKKIFSLLCIRSVQSLSHVRLCDPMNCSMLGLPVHHQLPESTQTHVHRVGDAIHLILCRPLFLLPPIPPIIRVFSNESTLHIRWPKYWSFSFSIIPSKEHPGLISWVFRMDWLDLLAVQGTLKSLLQHHSSKASILWCSAFFTE